MDSLEFSFSRHPSGYKMGVSGFFNHEYFGDQRKIHGIYREIVEAYKAKTKMFIIDDNGLDPDEMISLTRGTVFVTSSRRALSGI